MHPCQFHGTTRCPSRSFPRFRHTTCRHRVKSKYALGIRNHGYHSVGRTTMPSNRNDAICKPGLCPAANSPRSWPPHPAGSSTIRTDPASPLSLPCSAGLPESTLSPDFWLWFWARPFGLVLAGLLRCRFCRRFRGRRCFCLRVQTASGGCQQTSRLPVFSLDAWLAHSCSWFFTG